MEKFEPRALAADIAACVTFYTRLPAHRLGLPVAGFAGAQWAAPVAGLAVALCGGLVFALAHWSGLPAGPAAALALGATFLVTGGLHEDGLSDTADGFGGGATRERRLAIMRDSRIGTYGAAALVLSLLARWSALAALAAPGAVFFALVAAHGASRALMPLFMRDVENAREDGLSAGAGTVSRDAALAAAALGFLALLLLGVWGALVAALALAAWFIVMKRLAERMVGGRTGDVLGAVQQGAEIAVLLVACIFLISS